MNKTQIKQIKKQTYILTIIGGIIYVGWIIFLYNGMIEISKIIK